MQRLLIRTTTWEPPFVADRFDPLAHWLIDSTDDLEAAKERNPTFFNCRHGEDERLDVYLGFILATNTRDLGNRQITSTQVYALDQIPGRTMYCLTVSAPCMAEAIIDRLWAHPDGQLFGELSKPVFVYNIATENPVDCCADWKPQLDILNGFITLQAVRSGNPEIYSGIPFRFCPWCGAKVKTKEEENGKS